MSIKSKTLSSAMMASAVAMAVTASLGSASAAGEEKEKCYGISLAERLCRRPRHDLCRNVQGRLPGQCLDARARR